MEGESSRRIKNKMWCKVF